MSGIREKECVCVSARKPIFGGGAHLLLKRVSRICNEHLDVGRIVTCPCRGSPPRKEERIGSTGKSSSNAIMRQTPSMSKCHPLETVDVACSTFFSFLSSKRGA